MENLLVFDSTHQAMALETAAKGHALKARLIPIPETISAGCGLALKFAEQDQEIIKQLTEEQKMNQPAFYRIIVTEAGKHFEELN